MVLIHGFMSSRHQWDLNVEQLGQQFRTIVVELPGHGDSPDPVGEAGFSPAVVLAAIDDVRQRLGIERWWVIGQSLGGAVALRYALANQDRTSGVVFTNSRAAFGVGSNDGRPPAPLRVSSRDDLRRLPFHPVHAKRFPPALRDTMAEVADAMNPSVIDAVIASTAAWRVSDELHRLSVPVLLINGRWESRFQRHIKQARQSIVDLQVVDLEGGHSINIEQAGAFNRAVINFISERR